MVNNKLKTDLEQLSKALKDSDTSEVDALIGFDGFVDEIIHAVDKRSNAESYTRIRTLKDYGERIARAAGLSTNIELVPVKTKLGGNGPILSSALIKYGLGLIYIGALGKPKTNTVFKEITDNARCIPIANPARTDALEFEDGKLILSKLESFKEINWENIKKNVGVDKLAKYIDSVTLVSLNNWTMIPYMNEIWENMIEEVFPLLDPAKERKLFIDLADPEKRTDEDILDAMNLLKKFNQKFKIILGLNKKEALHIAHVLQIDNPEELSLKELTVNIAEKLEIYCLVIHLLKEAVAYVDGEYYMTDGPYTPDPVLTTGGGDNFNAGFCLGEALGFPVRHSLVLGTATSGYYVRKGDSPSVEDIIEFIKLWKEDRL